MQRELLPPAGRRPDVLFKAPEPVCAAPGPPHGPAGAASNFYSAVGRNGILPQGFDQFYEAAPGPPFTGPQPAPPPAPPQPEGAADKGDPKTGAGGSGGSPCAKATTGSEPKGAAEGSGGDGEGPRAEAGAEKSGGAGRHRVLGERWARGPLGRGGGGGLPLLAPFYVLLYKHSKRFIHPIRFPGPL